MKFGGSSFQTNPLGQEIAPEIDHPWGNHFASKHHWHCWRYNTFEILRSKWNLTCYHVFFLSACGLISHSYLISAPFAWFKFQCWDCTPIIPSAHRPGYPSPLPSLPISKFERRRTRDLFDRIGLCSCQYLPVKKQDAAHAPECSHETHGYAVTQNTFLQ